MGGLFGVLNVLLGASVVFYALKLHSDLKGASLSKPLVVIAVSFVLLIAHEAIDASPFLGVLFVPEELGGHMEHSLPSMLIETVFAIILFAGVIGFKTEFEKFEWVREVTRGSAKVLSPTNA